MKHTVKSLIGFSIGATDGEIGKVKEFYFDDKSWTIRYLIVETGSWLFGRKVLISPEAVITPDWEQQTFIVNLTKEQIKNSPEIDTDKPVSRQHEMDLYGYYPWTSYWAGGIGAFGMLNPVTLNQEAQKGNNDPFDTSENDPYLRSTDKVTGYSIQAIDGEIGDVEDFIIDYSTWKINFFLVDTGNWFPGKKVIISPKWVKEIKWGTSTVIVNATVERVKNSPEYDPGQEISESYESTLQNYYGNFIYHKQ